MPDDIFPVEKPVPADVTGLLRGMTDGYITLDWELERLEELADEKRAEREEVRKNIVNIMAQYGLSSQKFDDGLMIIRSEKPCMSVPSDRRPEFHRWLKKEGYWHLARINTKQEVALLRERLEEKQSIPDYVRIHKEPMLSIRGRKGSKA